MAQTRRGSLFPLSPQVFTWRTKSRNYWLTPPMIQVRLAIHEARGNEVIRKALRRLFQVATACIRKREGSFAFALACIQTCLL